MNSDGLPGALTGLRVLDLTSPMGAYCTKLMADMGADVIRIEPPGGDPARLAGPFVHDRLDPDAGIPFLFMNSHKRSVTLDLETADGRDLFRRLASRADIVVETFPPGWLEERDLGYAALAAENPGLIVTSITPFGQQGPYRSFKGSDLVGVAMGGLLRLCGFPGMAPDRPGGDQGYMLAGLHGLNGTLVALFHRDRTGEGQQVDTSMQMAVFLSTGYIVHWAEVRGIDLGRGGYRYNDLPGTFRTIYPCKDGWVIGGAGGRELGWRTLLDWMTEKGYAQDLNEERWQTFEYRRANWGHVEDVWAAFLLAHGREELFQEAQARRLTVMPFNTMEDVEGDPQLAARDFFRTVQHPRWGELRYPGPPFRSTATPLRPPAAAASAGEHTDEVLEAELGLARATVQALHRAGIV